jgi:hypothetical protein
MEFNNYGRDARERLHLGVNLREEPGSLPLKGARIQPRVSTLG